MEEFKGAPSLADKEADAAAVLAQQPDNLLRNLKVKDQHRTNFYPEGCAISEAGKTRRAQLVTAGDTNLKDSAEACADSCREARGCNAWLWCEDQAGCETEIGARLVHHACQLETQRPIFPIEPPVNMTATRFVAGFDGVNGPKKPVPADKRAAIIAPITMARCPLAYGLVSLKQAFINKRDYARLSSFEFYSRPVAKDPQAPGTWYRMLLLKQVLESLPAERTGWVLFLDQDVLVDEMSFSIPFNRYAGKDLVMWGSQKLVSSDSYQSLLSVSHKDRQQGLDTGVMLLRNSDWSRAFVDDVLAFLTDTQKQETLKQSLKTYEPLLHEQNAVALLLQDPERMEHVHFETEYCINCAWAHGLQGKLPFLKRFSECSFCNGFRNTREQTYECNSELVKTFGFSNRMALGVVGCGQAGAKSDAIQSTGPHTGEEQSSGSSSVPRLYLRTGSEPSGPSAMVSAAGFLRTHFFTMAFITVFLCGFLRRRRRRSSSD